MKPLLIGLLLDVSSSMALPFQRESTATRLHQLEEALDDLVARARGLSVDAPNGGVGLFGIFALGFGFGNLRTRIQGRNVPAVRHLLSIGSDSDDVVDGATLLQSWTRYRDHLAALTADMLGTTPMVEAFSRAERLLDALQATNMYDEQPVLLVVSDGAPTDPPDLGPGLVRRAAEKIHARGTVIISCFVGAQETAFTKTLYTRPQPDWPAGARLLFDCASDVASHPAFYAHLTEYDWQIPDGARLFTQVNQLDSLAEFSQTLLSPIEQSKERLVAEPLNASTAARKPVSVMVSYSHADKAYVNESRGSLLSYLRALERESVTFWCDRRLRAGDVWDNEIEMQLQRADIALVLVSQAFLNSSYCDKEAKAFIERRRTNGLRIVPIILSPCDWRNQPWLAETQVLPVDGRNIEQHYSLPGKRKALYLSILHELSAAAAAVAS
jgi:TIR domain